MVKIDVDFRRSNLECAISRNNVGAFLYMMKRSNLDLNGFLPGTEKTYIECAREYGADKIVESIIKHNKEKNFLLSFSKFISYL